MKQFENEIQPESAQKKFVFLLLSLNQQRFKWSILKTETVKA